MQTLNKGILKEAFFQWKMNDFLLIKFIIQGTLAALLALYLCMYFNLNMPQTSVFTVFLVMQVYSGMVYSKAFYRLIGSIIGTIVAIILASLFAQDRISFTLFFAFWIGICGSIGYMSRNFMSYGFVLSAYTIALVVMPTVRDFSNIFLFGIDRLSEVIIGLLCSSLVSDVFFPRKISFSLIQIENQKYKSLLNLLKNSDTLFELKKNNIDFNSTILGTNSLKINAQFETGMNRNKKFLYRRLNSKYMHLSTTLYSIKKIIHFNKDKKIFINSTKEVYDILKDSLIKFGQKQTNEDIKELIQIIKSTKKQIQNKVKEKKILINEKECLDDFESFVKLFFKLLNELLSYLNAHISFIENKKRRKITQHRKISTRLKFSTYDDKMFLSIVTFRNIATLFIVMSFWILSGWNLGIFSVIPAVAVTLLLSTIPNTHLAIKGLYMGLVLGTIITLFYNFYVIPKYVNDYITLCLVLTPIFIFISYLLYTPKRGIIGLGFIAVFINACLINSSYNMIFENTLDIVIATFLGLFIASIAFTIIKAGSSIWVEKRVKKLKQIFIYCLSQ